MEALRQLIEEWLAQHNGSQAELAELCGVPQNVISRWLNRQVDEASPKNLKKIAPALGLTYEELLREMGELPPLEGDGHIDPIEEEIRRQVRRRTDEMREAVRGTPRAVWATIIRKTFDRAVDVARDLAEMASSDNANAESADSALSADHNGASARPVDPLRPRYRVPVLA